MVHRLMCFSLKIRLSTMQPFVSAEQQNRFGLRGYVEVLY